MTQDELNQQIQTGNVQYVEPKDPTQERPDTIPFSEYEPYLVRLQRPKDYEASVPTDKPKNFDDCIRFIDDGTKKLAVYINGSWVTFPDPTATKTRIKVSQGSDQTLTTGGTYYTLACNVEAFDTNDEWDDTNYIFTASKAGYYTYTAFVTPQGGWTANDYFDISIKQNATEINYGRFNLGSTSDTPIFMITDTAYFALNDTLKVEVKGQSNNTVVQSGSKRTYITINAID